MTDERLLDAVEDVFVGSYEPVTLEHIYESVQAQIPGKLTESRRRQIRRILYSHRQHGLLVKTSQGRYHVGPGIPKGGGLYVFCGTPDEMTYETIKQSVVYFISDRKGEAFALRDLYGLERFYSDVLRDRYMIKRSIDELCRDGQLEPVGRMYRATASFRAEHDGLDDDSLESSARDRLKETAP